MIQKNFFLHKEDLKLGILFLIWRIVDIFIAYISQQLPWYKQSFQFGFLPYSQLAFPTFLLRLANFDGKHYLFIAHNGYGAFEQAFFPLYPLLTNFLKDLFSGSYLITGLFLSNITFLFGILLFYRFLRLVRLTSTQSFWAILFLVLFPTSFFFGSIYTEGLFFFLVSLALYAYAKRKLYVFAIASFFAALTRLLGVFLVLPILLEILHSVWQQFQRKSEKKWLPNINLKSLMKVKSLGVTLVAPLVGLITYMVYLWKKYGDPLLFYHVQSGFGAHRSEHLILLPQVIFRYLKIFLTASHDLIFAVAVVEFVVFITVLLTLLFTLYMLLQKKLTSSSYILLGLLLFSFINLLLPTTTGTLSSIPRYVLLSLSFFIQLGKISNPVARYALAVLLFALHVAALSFFIQGYFIA